MTQTVSHSSQNHSRLIRFLSELDVVDIAVAQRDFAERLGLLLNFSDSIQLSDALKLPAISPDQAEQPAPHAVRSEFLRVRGKLVAAIIESCSMQASNAKIRWPAPTEETPVAVSFEAFLRFYVAHQREMDLGVRSLRSSVRENMSNLTLELQHLVTLDIVLEDTLWDHSRRILAVIPRFLEKRFTALQQTSAPVEEWMQRFRTDVQGLLLAELELRLQPVLGLVETLDNEVVRTE